MKKLWLCLLLVGCEEPKTTCYTVEPDGGVTFSAECTEEEISEYMREQGIEQEVTPAPTP